MAVPTRLHTFAANETLTAANLNAEFNNTITAITAGTKDVNANSLTITSIAPSGNVTVGNVLAVGANFTANGATTFSNAVTCTGNVTALNVVSTGNTVLGNVTCVGTQTGGFRGVFLWKISASGITLADVYLHAGQYHANIGGYKMARAGSVIGYSISLNCNRSTNITVIPRIRKAGVNLWSGNTMTWTTTSTQYDTGTAAAGTYAFNAGDELEFLLDFQAGTGTYNSCYAMVEVVFTT